MVKVLLRTLIGACVLRHIAAFPFYPLERISSQDPVPKTSTQEAHAPGSFSSFSMRLPQLLLNALSVPVLKPAANIVLSNDDGWAEINIRQFYYALTNAGNSVIISAPADNKSGTGSADLPATTRLTPCEFNSCPAGSPAEGFNSSMKRFNYVNS